MDLNYSPEKTAFRDEVRGRLEQNPSHDPAVGEAISRA
jgi:hypothetical protein